MKRQVLLLLVVMPQLFFAGAPSTNLFSIMGKATNPTIIPFNNGFYPGVMLNWSGGETKLALFDSGNPSNNCNTWVSSFEYSSQCFSLPLNNSSTKQPFFIVINSSNLTTNTFFSFTTGIYDFFGNSITTQSGNIQPVAAAPNFTNLYQTTQTNFGYVTTPNQMPSSWTQNYTTSMYAFFVYGGARITNINAIAAQVLNSSYLPTGTSQFNSFFPNISNGIQINLANASFGGDFQIVIPSVSNSMATAGRTTNCLIAKLTGSAKYLTAANLTNGVIIALSGSLAVGTATQYYIFNRAGTALGNGTVKLFGTYPAGDDGVMLFGAPSSPSNVYKASYNVATIPQLFLLQYPMVTVSTPQPQPQPQPNVNPNGGGAPSKKQMKKVDKLTAKINTLTAKIGTSSPATGDLAAVATAYSAYQANELSPSNVSNLMTAVDTLLGDYSSLVQDYQSLASELNKELQNVAGTPLTVSGSLTGLGISPQFSNSPYININLSKYLSFMNTPGKYLITVTLAVSGTKWKATVFGKKDGNVLFTEKIPTIAGGASMTPVSTSATISGITVAYNGTNSTTVGSLQGSLDAGYVYNLLVDIS